MHSYVARAVQAQNMLRQTFQHFYSTITGAWAQNQEISYHNIAIVQLLMNEIC